MRITALSVGLILCSALLVADEQNVSVDNDIDFSAFKTFMVREARVNSSRPELSNQLFVKQITDTIRQELTKKKLTETSDRPDLIVDYSVTGVDYSIGPFGRANVIRPGQRGRSDPPPVSFTEATLVIDLRLDTNALVWHGVYRDPRNSAPKLAQKIPEGAKKLLSDYPPKKRSNPAGRRSRARVSLAGALHDRCRPGCEGKTRPSIRSSRSTRRV